jgi:uncharacterized protein Veg
MVLEEKMAENYMKQYIELSNGFRKNNKSQEIIGKLYDFINVLEKDTDKENKMVLTYVYTLLGYYKKSYDLYKTIYDENNRKQKEKLFDMEQMSKSHGDNFIIKLKKKHETNEAVNFTVNDFTQKEIDGEWEKYILNKTCIIFNQTFDHESLKISIHNKNELSGHISQINLYLKWLGGDCEKELIEYYNKNMDTEEKATQEWYEELEIYSVLITINKDGKIFSDISCGDIYWADHIFDIETDEYKIFSMNHDG